jgi:hypothetical protein
MNAHMYEVDSLVVYYAHSTSRHSRARPPVRRLRTGTLGLRHSCVCCAAAGLLCAPKQHALHSLRFRAAHSSAALDLGGRCSWPRWRKGA